MPHELPITFFVECLYVEIQQKNGIYYFILRQVHKFKAQKLYPVPSRMAVQKRYCGAWAAKKYANWVVDAFINESIL